MFHAGRNYSKASQNSETDVSGGGGGSEGGGGGFSNNSNNDVIGTIDINDIVDLDIGVDDDDVNVEDVLPQTPHFLDYDAVSPPDLEESFTRILTLSGQSSSKKSEAVAEQSKVDKKYERDGEISDYELAANGYTKKEFTQDDNTLHLASGYNMTERSSLRKSIFAKPKHFLDENPIPPDYMLEHESREHRSLDRNFERQHEQRQQTTNRSSTSPANSLRGERKISLDRCSNLKGMHVSGDRMKIQTSSSYALSRFLSSPNSARIPKGAAWTSEHFDNLYDNLHSSGTVADLKVDTLGPKVECVYSLLSMLGSNNPLDMSKKFLELSRTPETCATLRHSGCIPLLVQLMNSTDADESVRKYTRMALHNVVHNNPDEKAGGYEVKVLRLLDQITDYCNFLKTLLQSGGEAIADDTDRHPLAAISSLMKLSFDEEHRHAMCELGALQTIPNLVHLDHAAHGPRPENDIQESKSSFGTEDGKSSGVGKRGGGGGLISQGQGCNHLRRYALMALTNLTFGDEDNKAQLCSQKSFMEALVAQLDSAPDDLLQVTASVLRNLSWRANSNMKSVLNEIGTVTALARAAMKNKNENTLKAILSALWNLSAHCSTNKAEFCAVDGALAFLVDMLTYEGPSKTLKIIENAGGILRNVSSHIAVRENYRQILRERNCLSILLQQLKSESLTVVSNSCGTLWNLSARCPEDQKFLWDNGAVPMLRSLIHSKHTMISEGSLSALKNLLNFRPSGHNQMQLDPIARSMGLKKLPTLNTRKQRALEQELGGKLHTETCENLDTNVNDGQQSKENTERTGFDRLLERKHPHPLSVHSCAGTGSMRLTRSAMLTKSESRDSIFSAKSDSAYENLLRSHSASDTNRAKTSHKSTLYNSQRVAYVLKNDVESNEDIEQPINYSIKYNESSACKTINDSENENVVAGQEQSKRLAAAGENTETYSTYQETDLDQPTDFSLRYAENQTELDMELTSKKVEITDSSTTVITSAAMSKTKAKTTTTNTENAGNEVLLILEDTVKCYQTEDTPYVISNAASITDLRQSNKCETSSTSQENSTKPVNASASQTNETTKTTSQERLDETIVNSTNYASGSYTPEKPINYCEEGTPGYFSRYDSFSSLDDSPSNNNCATGGTAKKVNVKSSEQLKSEKTIEIEKEHHEVEISKFPTNSNQTDVNSSSSLQTNMGSNTTAHVPAQEISNMNSAQETPLMFSRHSSMDSLIVDDEDVVQCDDKSSVVSDFSRLASGVISPSEIPDSPTQSMPQSPRRHSDAILIAPGETNSPLASRGITNDDRRPLRSVFEDNVNTFHVEDTPAQFSCATSLSNLSIIDEPSNNAIPLVATEQRKQNIKNEEISNNDSSQEHIVSDGEEEATTNDDDMLLASCINIGMHRSTANATTIKSELIKPSINEGEQILYDETTKQYCTEDTPALLSKMGSNSNLSAISICSSSINPVEASNKNEQRRSLNLSDDLSSNTSEGDGANGRSADILQQCILDGIRKKPLSVRDDIASVNNPDPIAMMRRGGNSLSRYLPVADEMNKYIIEDSPCNFSVMSGLSNLTVGSSRVGPAVSLEGNEKTIKGQVSAQKSNVSTPNEQVNVSREDHWQDDSLSSLSIESEDDTNILNQAIAAGCNRPKSNIGFSSTSGVSSQRSNSLSSSQPIPINHGTASSTHSVSRHPHKQHQTQKGGQSGGSHRNNNTNINGNESYSSVDSSDSNDNQSKSLLELCILTGMHKSRDGPHSGSNSRHSRHHHHHHHHHIGIANPATQSNPNLKQFDSLPLQLNTSSSSRHKHIQSNVPNRHLRDRERKDEKLLLECINTGISKKISGGKGNVAITENLNIENRLHGIAGSECAMVNCVQPKNVQATSVAALGVEEVVLIRANTTNTAAASGVEMNKQDQEQYLQGNNIITYNNKPNNNYNCSSSNNNVQFQSKISNGIQDVITEDHANLAVTQIEDVVLVEGNPQSLVNVCEKMNVTGFNSSTETFDEEIDTEVSKSLENNSSNGSNESFIIETTVSLLEQQTQRQAIVTSTVSEKHKDPDLMLKSVERLTLEFVSSAEHLRTVGSSENSQREHRQGSISIGGGTSNNTWNENTHPNDVSFPSVSISVPIVNSLTCDDEEDDDQATEADHKELHDFAEITPTNEEQTQLSLLNLIDDDIDLHAGNSILPQLNSLETETETLVNDDSGQSREAANGSNNLTNNGSSINFKLGGAVQTAAAAGLRPYYNQTSLSAMTNSTMIANEARALAENLLQRNQGDDEELTFSINSLDLDNIRPPSGMESLNVSGYYQEQPNSLQRQYSHSPQICGKSPKFPRKTLPAGLVARRALGQFTGSAESVNSSYNLLENIKPPSLMDELLDSMISVSSIHSEVVDCCESMATTISASNYETATAADGEENRDGSNGSSNEFDDNTVTLHSCCDVLPCDDDDEINHDGKGSPLPTDNDNFSSAESTPRKSLLESPDQKDRRSLTPKMKRKLAKDRFKTYTIATTTGDSPLPNASEQEEMLQIEIVEVQNRNNRSSSRRRSSQDRYKTQTIVYHTAIVNGTEVGFENIADQSHNSLTSNDDCLSDDISSIRAMTKQFTHITANQTQIDEYNSTECEQNSETESCHDENININNINTCETENGAQSLETQKKVAEKKGPSISKTERKDLQQQQSKVIRGKKKPAYISPYSMQYQRSNTAPVTRVATNKSLAMPNNNLRKRTTNASTSCINSKVALRKKNVLESENPSSTPSTAALLDRQITFVKDEPTLADSKMPIVDVISSDSAKAAIKTSNNSSPKRSISKLPTKRTTIAQVRTNSGVGKINVAARKISLPIKPQRSNSNTNIRNTTTAAALTTRVSTTTPPSRSNSNLNTNDTNMASKINHAQSRIAGIWRRVNDARSKQQQQQQQTNQQVSEHAKPPLKPATVSRTTNLKTHHTKSATSLNNQSQQQLIRSSTFENLPSSPAAAASPSKTTAGKSIQTTNTKIAVQRNLLNGNTNVRVENRLVRK